jgi:hypothetical protein
VSHRRPSCHFCLFCCEAQEAFLSLLPFLQWATGGLPVDSAFFAVGHRRPSCHFCLFAVGHRRPSCRFCLFSCGPQEPFLSILPFLERVTGGPSVDSAFFGAGDRRLSSRICLFLSGPQEAIQSLLPVLQRTARNFWWATGGLPVDSASLFAPVTGSFQSATPFLAPATGDCQSTAPLFAPATGSWPSILPRSSGSTSFLQLSRTVTLPGPSPSSAAGETEGPP